MITPRTSRTTTDTGSDTSPRFDITRPSFWDDALCREPSIVAEVGNNFVDAERNKKQTARAMQACGRCLVMFECRQYALDDKTLVGIWGGTTTTARTAMRKNRRSGLDVDDVRGRAVEAVQLGVPIGLVDEAGVHDLLQLTIEDPVNAPTGRRDRSVPHHITLPTGVGAPPYTDPASGPRSPGAMLSPCDLGTSDQDGA